MTMVFQSWVATENRVHPKGIREIWRKEFDFEEMGKDEMIYFTLAIFSIK